MKINTEQFKRFQRVYIDLRNLNLDDLEGYIMAAEAADKARSRGTVFSQAEFEDAYNKLDTEDETTVIIDEALKSRDPKEAIQNIKLYFEDIPKKLRKLGRK